MPYRRDKEQLKEKKRKGAFHHGVIRGIFNVHAIGGLRESLVHKGWYGDIGTRYGYVVDEKPERQVYRGHRFAYDTD